MSDNKLPPLPDECEAWWWPKTVVDGVNEWGRAVEQAAYAAAYRAVKARDTGDMTREDMEARRCADAIRSLIEQPK